MTVELIYFAAPRDPALEERLAAACAAPRTGETRKAFLLALSEALEASAVALTVGDTAALSDALSRGLGLPPTAVDWAALGVEGDPDALLPKGALPLLWESKVRGFILESGPQAILALDKENALPLFDAYLAPYLEARADAEPAQPAAPEAPDEPDEPDEPLPANEDEDALPEGVRMTPEEPAYDVFAGMEHADIGLPPEEEAPKKKRKVWIPVLCVLLALLLALGGAGYWYLALRDGGAEGYYGTLMADVYRAFGDVAESGDYPSEYLLRFGALYEINPDVIGTVTVKGAGIDLPVVSAAGKEDYYKLRRFDGTFALYGTPYTNASYSEADVNPNLVIRGGSLFEGLNALSQGVGTAAVTTDSVLYGEDAWEIIAVLTVDDAGLANYDDSFAALTAAQRQARAKAALRASLCSTGLTEADLDNVGLSTNFLTLLTPSTSESGKTLVVFARRAAKADFEATPSGEEPTESQEPETSSEPTSSEEEE